MADPISAVIGGVATVAGGLLGSSASGKAASAQAQAAQQAGDLQAQATREQIAAQERMFERQIELQEPFRQRGITAINRMDTATNVLPYLSPRTQTPGAFAPQTGLPAGFDPQTGLPAQFTGQVDLQADPGYQFRLQEGLKALDRQAAARGGLISGAALKASQRYGQDLASQEYGAAYGRALTEYQAGLERNQLGYGREMDEYNLGLQLNQLGYGRELTAYELEQQRNQLAYGRELDRYNAAFNRAETSYNRLAGQAGFGQTASGQLAGAAGQTGANIANTIGQGAMLQGQALGAAGQARASGYVGQANALGGALGNVGNLATQYSVMNRLFPSGGMMPGQVATGANALNVNAGMGYGGF